jgi:hypothetical protein
MATIQFKGKIKTIYYTYQASRDYIQVPTLGSRHCDMSAFRIHPKYGYYANSDLFPGILARLSKAIFGGKYLYLDQIPEGVTVDTNGFLAVVTITIPG